MRIKILFTALFLFIGIQLVGQEKWTCYTDKSELLMDNQIVLGAFEYTDGSLWVVTDRGINTFKDGKWETINRKTDLLKNQIGSYMVDSQNRVWIGSGSPDMFFDGYVTRELYKGGVIIYDGKEWKPTFTKEMGINVPVVNTMFEASNGDIWLVASASKPFEGLPSGIVKKVALLHFDSETGEWTAYRQKDIPCRECNFVNEFYEDDSGRVYFIAAYGIFYFEEDSFHIIEKTDSFSYRYPSMIVSRFKDSKNNLWLGSLPLRIYSYDRENWRAFTQKHGLKIKNGHPYGFVETSDNKIIMTSANGLFTYDGEGQWMQEKIHYIYGNSFIDKDNRLWIPAQKGLIIRDGANETMHKNIPKVKYIFEDKNRGIWALSRNNGAWRFKDGEWELFGKDNQLPSDNVGLVHISENGTLWFNTNKGICSCEYE
ncbi:MAG: hypothetical protein KJO20_12125 [Eudoraea sp.]|nr:hypothetical protein [Eudoraea sp.]MBT8293636.1 hypothetical protein [Eudoraea sp.]